MTETAGNGGTVAQKTLDTGFTVGLVHGSTSGKASKVLLGVTAIDSLPSYHTTNDAANYAQEGPRDNLQH